MNLFQRFFIELPDQKSIDDDEMEQDAQEYRNVADVSTSINFTLLQFCWFFLFKLFLNC